MVTSLWWRAGDNNEAGELAILVTSLGWRVNNNGDQFLVVSW